MILTNCRLIPELCEGFQADSADIRIEGNTIAEILPAGGKYTGEEVIDCAGKTVIPGLFDIHAHLWNDDFSYYAKRMDEHTEYSEIRNSIRFMYRLLAYGYTSIRDSGCGFQVAKKLRDDVNAGNMIGPDIKTPGQILNPDLIHFDMPCHIDKTGNPVNNPWAVRAAVRRMMRDGMDYIKVYGCGPDNAGKRGGGPVFYPDEMEELANAVKREGTYMAIHCTSEEAIACAIEYEAHSIEHALWFSQANLDQLIAKGYKSTIVPTTRNVALLTDWPGYGPDCVKGLRYAYDEGNVLMGFGTDQLEAGFIQDPAMEFWIRDEILGFDRIDILKQATINSAKINGTDDLRGSIKVGKRADFAVINGNPDENLRVFVNPPEYVIKDGAVVARNGFINFNQSIGVNTQISGSGRDYTYTH